MKTIISTALVAALAGSATANVVLSELHFSTTGTDAEYVELYNDGTGGNVSVDISGWTVTRWEASTGEGDFGTADTLTVQAGTILGVGDTFTFGSAQAQSVFGPVFDQSFSNDFFENGHSTFVFADDLGNIIWSAFSEDPGEGGFQDNIGGAPFVSQDNLGLDGTFQVPGYYRTDAAGSFTITDFGNGAPNNPGVANYPAVPTPGALALLGLGGLTAARRRR